MQKKYTFSQQDIEQLASLNLGEKEVLSQLAIFEKGQSFPDLVRPCTVGDGIRTIKPEQIDSLGKIYEQSLDRLDPIKFVPASGASTRMLKPLFAWRDKFSHKNSLDIFNSTQKQDKDTAFVFYFFKNIKRFAFWPLLEKVLKNQGVPPFFAIKNSLLKKVIGAVLDQSGLGYGSFPKGLIPFHRYENSWRTPFEEHLVEASQYCKKNNVCRVHFSVGKKFFDQFEKMYEKTKPVYENLLGVVFDVSFSIQSPSTDTLAVTIDNLPFRTPDGKMLFRPGGHGSLIKNLDNLDFDIVFINNIDNVVPDRLKENRAIWKKACAGLLVFVQEKSFSFLKKLTCSVVDNSLIEEASEFACEYFGLGSYFKGKTIDEKKILLIALLDRPIRVCGMVKNQGNPGGAPFWVREKDGNLTIQIIEAAQVNQASDLFKKIFNSSTFFNPVDIICGLKNFKKRNFSLESFVDKESFFISDKSKDGLSLKALEHPGLWNGSMSGWNSVFLEVPLVAFNPVKTINDLLFPSHR